MVHGDEAVWDSAVVARLLAHLRLAEEWIDLARRQVESGIWVPTPEELAMATALVAAVDPPHTVQTDTALRRLEYLARWAPQLNSATTRLSDNANSTAHRVQLSSIVRVAPASPVALSDIRSAVFPLIANAEQWLQDYTRVGKLDPDAAMVVDEIDALLVAFTDVLVRVVATAAQDKSLPAA